MQCPQCIMNMAKVSYSECHLLLFVKPEGGGVKLPPGVCREARILIEIKIFECSMLLFFNFIRTIK